MKYSGIWIPYGRFRKPMAKVLRRWIAYHKRYYVEMLADSGDVTYWYDERTHVGIFASAIWAAGGLALEEYGDEKRSRINKDGPENGRVDLYFKVGKLECIAEAKRRALPSTLRASKLAVAAKMAAWVKEARNDARKCPPDARRMGLVFIRPWVNASKQGPLRLRKHIELLVEAARRTKPAFVAWHFDRSPASYEKTYWPGIMVIGNVLRRS